MGVRHPEKVCLLVLKHFLFSQQDTALAGELEKFGLNSPNVESMTIGYIILIKSKYVGNKWLLAHQLVHVSQIERMGTELFLHQTFFFLKQLVTATPLLSWKPIKRCLYINRITSIPIINFFSGQCLRC